MTLGGNTPPNLETFLQPASQQGLQQVSRPSRPEMKRKLSDRDDGEALDKAGPPAKQQAVLTFQSLGLDPRILAGVQSEKFSTPTPVQAKAIPLALEGRDILGKHTPHYLHYTFSSTAARLDPGRRYPSACRLHC